MANEEGGGSNSTIQDILATYQMLSSLTPLITAAATGGFDSGGGGPSQPSVLQNMVVQSLINPKKPIQVSMRDLMNPNILGLGSPRRPNQALPYAAASMQAFPAVLKGIGGLTNLLGLGQKPGPGQPGGGAPTPMIDPNSMNFGGSLDFGGGSAGPGFDLGLGAYNDPGYGVLADPNAGQGFDPSMFFTDATY